jgi:hypothetical protein
MTNPTIEIKTVQWYDGKEKTTVILTLWGENTGKEILSVQLFNPTEGMIDPEFQNSKEWEKIRPEVEKGCYQLLSLLIERS